MTTASMAMPFQTDMASVSFHSVGMHDVAVIVVAAEVVGYDFAEGFREKAFVDVFDGVVNVFF